MDIGAVGGKGDKGKGKGKEKGKDKDKPQREQPKGPKGGKGKGDKPCAICGPDKGKNHSTADCWFNARAQAKGKAGGKGDKSKDKGKVSAVALESEAATGSSGSSFDQQIAQLETALQSLKASAASSEVSSVTPSASASQAGRRKGVDSVRDDNADMMFAIHDEECMCAVKSGKKGLMMVDSGAVTSCTRLGAFKQTVDSTQTKQLYSITGHSMQHRGVQQAKTWLQEQRSNGTSQSVPATFNLVVTDAEEDVMALCNILDNADCDVHFHRARTGKPSFLEKDSGERILLKRLGKRFYLPFEERDSPESGMIAGARGSDKPGEAPGSSVEFHPDDVVPEEMLRGPVSPEPEAAAEAESLEGSAQKPLEPRPLAEPASPTQEEERDSHNLHHAQFASWCNHCVATKAPDDPHKRKPKDAESHRKLLQIDYQFFGREGQLVEFESRLATALCGTDTSTGYPLMAFVPAKGSDDYVLGCLTTWVDRLGYDEVLLQYDQESPIRSVAQKLQEKLGTKRLQLRESPQYSSQSLGAAENTNREMAGMLRCWLSVLNEKYSKADVTINHQVVPWLCRHVAWLWARFHK